MFGFKLVINDKQWSAASSFLDTFPDKLFASLDKDLAAAAQDGENFAKQNAHVITGEMRDSISSEKVGNLHYRVVAAADHSGYENDRGGDHAFFDKAVQQVESKHPNILISNVKELVSSSNKK